MICERGVLALSAWSRTKGLLGRSSLDDDEGLWIQPTSSIHMWFMRIPLDVIWTSADGRVLKLTENIKPWRIAFCHGAKVALELPVGAIARSGVQVGDHVVIEQ